MLDQASQLRRLMVQAGRQPGPDDIPAPRKLVISGGKTGLGSTTLAVNLAVALATHGSRTVLVDADLYRADVAAHCGLAEAAGIGEVLLGRKGIHEVLQRGPAGIQVVIGARTTEARNACSEKALQRVLRQIDMLGRHVDIVLIDTGNGPTEPTIRFWQAADEVLLLTTPDAVAVMDTYATVKTLLTRAAAHCPLGLVINQVEDETHAADVHRRIDQSCLRFLGVSLAQAGWLPSDDAASAAARRGQPLVLNQAESPLSNAIERLAERILTTPQQTPRQQRLAA